jgi:hypothetical protein
MELINVQTGMPEDVSHNEVGEKFASGQYGFRKSQPVFLMSPEGRVGEYVPEDVHMAVTKGGYSFPTEQDMHEYEMQKKYGDKVATSFALGLTDAATFGMGTRVADAGGLLSKEALKEIPNRNPVAHLAGTATGFIGSLALTPEAEAVNGAREALQMAKESGDAARIAEATQAYRAAKNTLTLADALNPVGAVSKVGNSAAELIGYAPLEASAAQKMLYAAGRGAAQGATEGLLYGVGEVNREEALGDPKMTVGHIASQLGFSALMGGVFGGLLHAGMEGKALTEEMANRGVLAKFGSQAKEKLLEKAHEKVSGYVGDTVTDKLFEVVAKSKENLENAAKLAVKPIADNASSEVGLLAAKLASSKKEEDIEKLKEDKKEQLDKFHKISHEISLMKSNPNYMVDVLDNSTKDLYQYLPKTSQEIQAHVMGAVNFLDSKLPKQTNDSLFLEKFIPSQSDLNTFFKYYNTIQKPASVLDSVKNHTVSKEEIEALKSVYPQFYDAMRASVLQQAATLKEKPDYQKRLALSLFLGQNVDSSTKPVMIAANQMNFQKVRSGNSNKSNGLIKPTSKAMGNLSFSSRYTMPLDKSAQRAENRET